MKELIKKISLVLVAVLLLVGNVTQTVSALTGNEDATVTIENVENGSTVQFYQVVTPNIDSKGHLVGYNLVNGLVDPEEIIDVTPNPTGDTANPNPTKLTAAELDVNSDGVVDNSPVTINGVQYTFTSHAKDVLYEMEAPTQEQINKAVSEGKLQSITPKEVTVLDGNRVQKAITAGQYIVLITPPADSEYTYNPLVVSAGYEGQQIYKVGSTLNPAQQGTHYKRKDGTFVAVTDTANIPNAENKHLFEDEAWDSENNKPADPRWVAVGATTEDQLIAKNLDADSKYTYPLNATNLVAKRKKVDVEKDVETDHPEENVDIALVATDEKGDCKLDDDGKLVYVKAPFNLEQHKATQNGTKFYKIGDNGQAVEWIDGTDDDSLKVTLSAMETSDAHLASTVKETAYNAGQGEEVRYTVTPTIPQYPTNAKNKTLSFTDKFDTGIDFVPGSIDIYVPGKLLKEYAAESYSFYRAITDNDRVSPTHYLKKDGTFTDIAPTESTKDTYNEEAWNSQTNVANAPKYVLVAVAKENTTDGNTFQINFKYDAIPGEEGKKAISKIEYKGLINSSAIQGIPGNVNVVKMHYSNSTGQGDTWEEFEEPSGDGYTEQHDEGRAYTYEIRFVKTNDKDQYINAESNTATHVRIPDAEKDSWSDAEKTAYKTLVTQAIKGYEADGTEHMYVTIAQFTTATSAAGFPATHDLDKGLFKLNPEFEYLSKAVFGLYDKNNKLVCEVEVDDTGVGHTTNISDGNYTLVELVPPPGYTKDSTPIPVTANWTSATTWSKHSAKREIYTVDPNEALDAPNPEQIGWLVGEGTNADFYDLTPTGTNKPVVTDFDEETQTAKIDGVLVENVYKAYLKLRVTTESETENTVYNNNGGTISLARVNNSKTPKLPSTGGIGTYMFTIAGVAILAIAAFMLIFKKQKVQ